MHGYCGIGHEIVVFQIPFMCPWGGGGGKKGAFDAKGCPWELGIGILKSSNPHLCPTYPLLGGVGRNIDGRITYESITTHDLTRNSIPGIYGWI